MGVLSKGTTFADGTQVTSTNLNNLVDAAVFTSSAVDDATTQLSSGKIVVKTIQTGNIANSAVTTAKLANSTGTSDGVTTAKIADQAVTTAKIADDAVTQAKIADAAVGTAQLINANITAAKLDGAQSGSAPIYAARAWVNFNGTGTVAIRASGNVTSITDNGTGDYTVNFTTAMPDANYAFVGTSSDSDDDSVGPVAVGAKSSTYVPTTTGRRFETVFNGTNYDSTFCSVVIFR